MISILRWSFSVALATTACGDDGATSSTAGVGGVATTTSTNGGASASTGENSGGASSGGEGGRDTRCPEGSVEIDAFDACDGEGALPTPAQVALLVSGERGEVVSLAGVDVPSQPCPAVVVCRPTTAPTLVFSDEPETSATSGILYADVLSPGAYRAYVYHVNAATPPRKFPVVVLNQGTEVATLTVRKRALAGPGTDYLALGKSAATTWRSDTRATVLSIAVGARVLLDAELDGLHAAKDELVHAIVDFDVDRDVKLSVVSVAADVDATIATATLAVIPSSGLHDRGTFPNAEVWLVGDRATSDTIRGFTIGANRFDRDLAGTSFVDGGAPVTLRGGFGVVYRASFRSGGEGVVALSPRGGAWSGSASISDGLDASMGSVSLPSAMTAIEPGDGVIHLGRFAGDARAEVSFMTAGASSLPIKLLWIPTPRRARRTGADIYSDGAAP